MIMLYLVNQMIFETIFRQGVRKLLKTLELKLHVFVDANLVLSQEIDLPIMSYITSMNEVLGDTTDQGEQ